MANVLQELKDINNNIPLCSCSELTEQDIPGARLSKQPEKCKVSDLRVWLQCRGQTVRTKLTKAELCLRVKRCQESGEDYTFVDPYPGQPHLVRKRNNCKKCSTQSDCKHITSENKNLIWCNDASVLPKAFNYLNLLEHSKKSGKKQESVEKPLNRGYSFFHDGYVHEVQSAKTPSGIHFRCKCFRSMKKHESPHKVSVQLHETDGKVLNAECSCVAGTSGLCNHVFALLYLLDHSVKVELKEFGRKKTCTEEPQKWQKPRFEGIRPESVMKGTVVRPRYGAVTSGIKSSLYDARAENAREQTKIEEAIEQLKMINPLIGICQTGSLDNERTVKTSLDVNAPVGSILSYQLSLTEGGFDVIENISDQPSEKFGEEMPLFPWKDYFAENVDDSILEQLKLNLTKSEASHLESKTKEQSACNEWFQARRYRLTASKFGHILKRKKDKESYVLKYLLSKPNLSQVPSVQYGVQNEENAVQQYIKYMANSKHKTKVYKCGVVVNSRFPWLAASPDRVTYNDDIGFGLLEVKCSHSKKKLSPKESCIDKTFFCTLENGKFCLKKDHEYYAQVQGQLGVCGATYCDFVVYTDKGLGMQRILFDESFWCEMVGKLKTFFMDSFVPVVKKNMK